ncbi:MULTISPECIES: hypothetical protein [Pseudomonas]|uniref:hypothetical protein n=1 Tax=Pseudomonas TaxID=286 RepID=UPI00112F0292|nr:MULTISPECIES: hypothetical protein [Pseudomonas]NMZ49534.1 hypothetical protein [Pseudomonas poae]
MSKEYSIDHDRILPSVSVIPGTDMMLVASDIGLSVLGEKLCSSLTVHRRLSDIKIFAEYLKADGKCAANFRCLIERFESSTSQRGGEVNSKPVESPHAHANISTKDMIL